MRNRVLFLMIFIVSALVPLWADEALTITNNGNVGINTANPQTQLEVTGDVKVTGQVSASGGVNMLKATQVINNLSFSPPVVVTISWVPVKTGNLVYSGGQLVFMLSYSSFHCDSTSTRAFFLVGRVQISKNGGNSFYYPSENGWAHHTNEYCTHAVKSLTFTLDPAALDGPGDYTITFWLRKYEAGDTNNYYLDGNDHCTLTVLELPK